MYITHIPCLQSPSYVSISSNLFFSLPLPPLSPLFLCPSSLSSPSLSSLPLPPSPPPPPLSLSPSLYRLDTITPSHTNRPRPTH